MARRNLKNARIIVTGASSGIGRELVLQLARFDARVIATARRSDRLQKLAEQFKQRTETGDIRIVTGDITEPDVRAELVATAVRDFGGLDGIVNNAGIGGLGPFADASPERLRQIMEVNFFAPAELTRLAISELQQGRRPVIVNVGSVLGYVAVPKKSEYCASKFALHGFSDSLRAELSKRGIDVVLVAPNTTESEFFDNVIERRGEQPSSNSSAMSPESVARHILRAMQGGRRNAILSLSGKMLIWAYRLMPGVVGRLIARYG